MSLTTEKKIANTKKYFETLNKFNSMSDSLMTFLGEEFIKAPYSNMKTHHLAYEGGLIEHLLNVAKYAVKINDSLEDNERVDKTSLIKIALLHQIGKAHLYIPCESEWHREKQGKLYDFNTKLTPMRISERSILYLQKHGIELSEDEYVAILNMDKQNDLMSEYHNNLLGEIIKMANTLVLKIMKK